MTIELTPLAQGSDSGIVVARRTIVRDLASWRALWAAHAGPEEVAPDVDFATRMVAAVFAGERPSPGHTIRITGADAAPDAVTLFVAEQTPPRGMASAQLLVSPFHIVTLPRIAGEVRFADAATAGGRVAAGSAPHVAARRSRGTFDNTVASSTGLEPNFAAALAYLAGPFSGTLILLVERASPYVRFHAWQAVLGLGSLGLLAAVALLSSFLTLLLSPLAFTGMYRLSEVVAVLWIVAWVWCLVKAFTGRVWKMPVAGRYAERLATRPMLPPAG
ncbi:MAG: hypothetical protein V7647_4074 [Acidobacteriota bacterium]|jgi:uncharacterized membrane protein